jgi:glycosyltransferase involved in cell wall biosynthesis
MRLAIVTSHPIQYYAPLFRELSQRTELTVLYAHQANDRDQSRAGFGVGFSWDVDLLSGYRSEFLENKASNPGLGRFAGVDTPGVGRRLRDGRFDAVLLTGWYLKCFHQALLSSKLMGLPVMVRGDSHLDTPRSKLKVVAKRAVYPNFLRLFDAALYVGERNLDYWRHYGYPAKRLFHSPHCVDNAWFAERATQTARNQLRQRLGIGAEARVVLFAGKLVPFKRPLDVVDAVGEINRRGAEVEILVAGSGELETSLRNAAMERGVKLHMLGFCNQTEMPKVYAASDLLVLPSDGRETWGLVVNEALASGTPALVSDSVGCALDLARALGGEYVFPLGNTRILGEQIEVLTSRDVQSRLRVASNRYSLDAASAGIIAATKSVQRKRLRHD